MGGETGDPRNGWAAVVNGPLAAGGSQWAYTSEEAAANACQRFQTWYETRVQVLRDALLAELAELPLEPRETGTPEYVSWLRDHADRRERIQTALDEEKHMAEREAAPNLTRKHLEALRRLREDPDLADAVLRPTGGYTEEQQT